MASNKIIIYQVFSRLYGNRCTARKPFGSIDENGCGKLNDFTPSVLKQIREMGVSHVWYTGVIRHATVTDYSVYGIPRQHPAVVKGVAGSPYAIADYYDIDPDLAVNVDGNPSVVNVMLVAHIADNKLYMAELAYKKAESNTVGGQNLAEVEGFDKLSAEEQSAVRLYAEFLQKQQSELLKQYVDFLQTKHQ